MLVTGFEWEIRIQTGKRTSIKFKNANGVFLFFFPSAFPTFIYVDVGPEKTIHSTKYLFANIRNFCE